MSQYLIQGSIIPQAADAKEADLPSALFVDIECDSTAKKVIVWGKKENIGNPTRVELNGMQISVNYGAGINRLPFYLKLNAFILKRYPGSLPNRP